MEFHRFAQYEVARFVELHEEIWQQIRSVTDANVQEEEFMILSTLASPFQPQIQAASQSVFNAVNGAVSRLLTGIDRFVAQPSVEPRVANLFYDLAQGTDASLLLTGYPARARAFVERLFDPDASADSQPLGRLERGEYVARHMALSAMLAPLLGGFLYSANPEGVRLEPDHLRTMIERYFSLLENDAARVGVYYPRHLLRVAFSDIDREALIAATSETRKSMMEAIGRRDGYFQPHQVDRSKYPSYFFNLFHWRSWFEESSALSWDSMTEILFAGLYGAMQRAALPATIQALISAELGRDKSERTKPLQIVEVGAGTGTFAQYVLETWQWLKRSTPLDYGFIEMSPTNRQLARRRLESYAGRVRLWDFEQTGAMAEKLPYSDASVDVIVAINLYHELPPHVRRQAAAEAGRVLKPGGRLVFYDSVQKGDGIDSLLRAFGESGHGKAHRTGTFHEPYIPGYALEDLDVLFKDAGFRRASPVDYAYMAKGMVFEKRPDR